MVNERTCVVCRKKGNKSQFFRLAKIDSNRVNYIFDKDMKHQSRGAYVCRNTECLKRLGKHKKIKMSSEDLFKMANELKEKDYLNILRAMKNSGELTFGMNMVIEEINHIHFMVIATDIGEKNNDKLIVKAKDLGIKYVHCGTKYELGEIFGKAEITVIAIKDKKMARGLIN